MKNKKLGYSGPPSIFFGWMMTGEVSKARPRVTPIRIGSIFRSAGASPGSRRHKNASTLPREEQRMARISRSRWRNKENRLPRHTSAKRTTLMTLPYYRPGREGPRFGGGKPAPAFRFQLGERRRLLLLRVSVRGRKKMLAHPLAETFCRSRRSWTPPTDGAWKITRRATKNRQCFNWVGSPPVRGGSLIPSKDTWSGDSHCFLQVGEC